MYLHQCPPARTVSQPGIGPSHERSATKHASKAIDSTIAVEGDVVFAQALQACLSRNVVVRGHLIVDGQDENLGYTARCGSYAMLRNATPHLSNDAQDRKTAGFDKLAQLFAHLDSLNSISPLSMCRVQSAE